MKIIDVVAAILEQNGQILLAQRGTGSDQAGQWEFPGGKVETGESQPEALARELDEELGICARIGDYVGSNQWQQGERIIRLHARQVTEFSGELQQRCHSALVWVTPQQAQEYVWRPPTFHCWRTISPRKAVHAERGDRLHCHFFNRTQIKGLVPMVLGSRTHCSTSPSTLSTAPSE